MIFFIDCCRVTIINYFFFRDERGTKDSNHENSNNSDSGFSSPVPSKHHIMGMTENAVFDNSSEDSFHSSASENGKGTK